MWWDHDKRVMAVGVSACIGIATATLMVACGDDDAGTDTDLPSGPPVEVEVREGWTEIPIPPQAEGAWVVKLTVDGLECILSHVVDATVSNGKGAAGGIWCSEEQF